eukprot:GHVT01005989.1.p1 GENE.GHVT01005989.1~~GHVT01005989.1.p1  ORF type:complete len:127 (-),score=12.94 GHVT01005989.1:93-425(-)
MAGRSPNRIPVGFPYWVELELGREFCSSYSHGVFGGFPPGPAPPVFLQGKHRGKVGNQLPTFPCSRYTGRKLFLRAVGDNPRDEDLPAATRPGLKAPNGGETDLGRNCWE